VSVEKIDKWKVKKKKKKKSVLLIKKQKEEKCEKWGRRNLEGGAYKIFQFGHLTKAL
jgi:hypothetical protein